MNKIKKIAILALGACMLAGCASQGGGAYKTGEQRQVMRIQRGVVTEVSVVQVSNDSTMMGPAAGGVVGGVLGSMIGSGKGRTLAILGGAAAGAAGGAAVEKGIRDGEALQILVRLDSGEEIAVVQDMDVVFRMGDRVKVLSGSGATRVQHD
ncbi:glycine zipper 2TM domain-containing protein [Desulfovibrio sp. OttesenSCG-928-C14]|nr:glycine zipper 2TM domain-containing protein [Desulfovibrio sp. OttesenSCG-928-C14]